MPSSVPSATGQTAPAPPPDQILMQLATGHLVSSCLQVAAQLKIADQLAGGPQSTAELARRAGANEDALYRVLRALSSLGVFAESGPRMFSNTPVSELIRSDYAGSMLGMVRWISSPMHFRAYAELMHTVKTGGTALQKATGLEAFEYFEKNPEIGVVFNEAMTSLSAMVMPAVLEAYDFSGLGTLADIAGGHGFALTSVLQKHPGVRGIVFDLPHVVEGTKARVESLGLSGRCEVMGGDFFQGVPQADNYMMKHIIHDWDDERAFVILRNCVQAMRGKGKVLLIEAVIGPENFFASWGDIEMLALPGGRERTEAEFKDLFSRAGLRLTRIVPTKSPVCVIEAARS